ncbi:MAG: CDP-alcohol phosphatidyltransferase family protein [Rhodospirillales bacterium]|nr:CDP-alcohol phosphatidyltransferase family protein [Acetobacter sp.]
MQKQQSPQPPAQHPAAATDNSSNATNTSKPIARSLSAARERTRAVREKVRSSLTNLTPRENIYNIPNLLTVSRLIAAPVTAYLLVHDHFKWALALFAYAGITDLVDGWMARKWKLQTVAGSVMDPMADKGLMIVLTVTLAVKGAIPRKSLLHVRRSCAVQGMRQDSRKRYLEGFQLPTFLPNIGCVSCSSILLDR